MIRHTIIKAACLYLSLAISLTAPAAPAPTLETGIWKGVLHRPDGHDIVFNFEIARQKSKPVMYVKNGDEKLLVDNIRQNADSVWIQMPFFASAFSLKVKSDGNLEGNYIKNYGNRQQVIPFTALHGDSVRYPAVAKPVYNISGRWAVAFEGKDDVSRKAVGEFIQKEDGTLTGTFLTPTGDYRYLQGTVNADTLQLSAFDGGHAILFTAKLDNDSTISTAALFSGLSGSESWTAKKDDHAELPDSYRITGLKTGESRLNFTFKNTDGKPVSINDKQYKNKVVVIQILGSWCPNCMDETAFLSDYYKQNRQRGVEIIGLAYERTEDFNESQRALQPFRKRFDVQYPFLITGVSVNDENRTEKTLPQLDKIRAFPTTIFVGKDGKVARIHTGFNGPATGEHYDEFKKEFNEEIQTLLNATE